MHHFQTPQTCRAVRMSRHQDQFQFGHAPEEMRPEEEFPAPPKEQEAEHRHANTPIPIRTHRTCRYLVSLIGHRVSMKR